MSKLMERDVRSVHKRDRLLDESIPNTRAVSTIDLVADTQLCKLRHKYVDHTCSVFLVICFVLVAGCEAAACMMKSRNRGPV